MYILDLLKTFVEEVNKEIEKNRKKDEPNPLDLETQETSSPYGKHLSSELSLSFTVEKFTKGTLFTLTNGSRSLVSKFISNT